MNTKKIFLIFVVFLLAAVAVVYFVLNQFNQKSSGKTYQIGLLQMASTVNANMDGFRSGMEDFNYVEGVNVNFDYFNAEGDMDVLKKKAAEFASKNFDLIFVNTSPATQAIKEATANSTVPVVFSMVADPVYAGFVKSIQNSENNLTGTSCAYINIAGKRLEALKEVVPGIKRVLVFYRPGDKSGEPAASEIKKTGQKLGVQVILAPVADAAEIKKKLDSLKPGEVDAMMDPADATVTASVDSLVAASLKLKIPLMMMSDREAEKGATITYGVDYFDLGKQSARLAAKILEGAKPAEIPIEMPRIFRLVVNLQSAQKIGLSLPSNFLDKADRIIK
jgi:putative ABC transport system substrate-binding protein